MSGLVTTALKAIHDTDPATEIANDLGDDLDKIRIGGADVLVAVYKRPEKARHGSLVVHLPDQKRDEDDVQGVVGLVLMMGPYAYKTEKTRHWFVDKDGEPAPPKIGDWVAFDTKATLLTAIGKRMCRYVPDQYIRAILTEPDIVI
jgi:hypothetical protein